MATFPPNAPGEYKDNPYKNKLWSIPPVWSTDPAKLQDQSFAMLQGVVYEIQIAQGDKVLLQNVSENEDDYVEVSHHGDPEGKWFILNTHSAVEAKRDIYMLNRTHKQNCIISVILQEDITI